MSRGWIAVAVTCLSLGACGDGSDNAPPDSGVGEAEFVTAEIPIEAVFRSSDRGGLVLQYDINSESKLDHAEVEEGADGIEVGMVGTVPGAGPHTLAARAGCVSIESELSEPPQVVTDSASGRTLKVRPIVRQFSRCPGLAVE